MALVEYRSPIAVSQQELFAWHERPGAFERLVAPWQDVRVVEKQGGIRDGDTTVLSLKIGPMRRRWVARHFGYEPPRKFQDEQVEGPFRSQTHTHLFLSDDSGTADRSVLVDRLDFEPPLGGVGSALLGGTIRRQLDQAFLYRHRQTQIDLARHARFATAGPLRIAISGASGLIGKTLRAFLTTGGHQVEVLVRRKADRAKGEIEWNPATGLIDAASLEGVDVVVHLSGESVSAGRWNAARMQQFVDSRVKSTQLMSRTLAGLKRPPRVFVSASATGFYGDCADEILTESSPKGSGFFPDLCEQWEASAQSARSTGIRVVHPRIGIVLSARGGALGKMLTPFKMGAGGVIGSGRQYLGWIAIDDLIGVIHETIFNDTLTGPVNAVAPNPVTNREFVKTLGRVLGRPTVLPLPAPAVNLIFGEMGRTLLLEGARVMPAKLAATTGFAFRYPMLESALRAELGKEPIPPGWGNVSNP